MNPQFCELHKISFSNVCICSFLLLCLFVRYSHPTYAQQRPFGAGLIIGDPTGFTGKYWNNRESAYAFGLAWSLGDEDTVRIYGDYLWHRFEVTGEARTPLYFGVGIWLGSKNNDTGLGVRIPLGITHVFSADPIDVFFEIVPTVDLAPDTDLGVQGGFGVRYYFKSGGSRR